MVFGHMGQNFPSLAGWVDAGMLNISREALHKRLNESACEFLRLCLSHILTCKLYRAPLIRANTLNNFSKIHIFDSSFWRCVPSLSHVFPGAGGSRAKACCKLQLGYEIKTGTLKLFEITPATANDQGYSKKLPDCIKKGELCIFDLGYFTSATFHAINAKGGYFLSRYNLHSDIYNAQSNDKINLVPTLKKLNSSFYQIQVIIGKYSKLPTKCRFVCFKAPQEVANRRRQKLRQTLGTRNKVPSKKALYLCNWTIFITNAPSQMLPARMILDFYPIRWQVELIFKQFKSILRIHKSNIKTNENRFICEIYGKLIATVITHSIHGFWNAKLWNSEKSELSFDKFWKRIQERAFCILTSILHGSRYVLEYLNTEIPKLLRNAIKLPQKSRLSTLQTIHAYGT